MNTPYPHPGQQNSGGYPQAAPYPPVYDPTSFPPALPAAPYGQGAPGGGTAKVAAGLGILLAVLRLVEFVYVLVRQGLSWFDLLDAPIMTMIAGHVLEAVLLVVTAVLLLRGRATGKGGLAVVAALVLPYALVNTVRAWEVSHAAVELLNLVVGIAVLTLCLVPATGRWLRAVQQGSAAGAPFAGRSYPAQSYPGQPPVASGAPLPGQGQWPIAPGAQFPGPGQSYPSQPPMTPGTPLPGQEQPPY